MTNISHSTPKSEFWDGVKATFPLVIGAIPFGIIFGALAVNAGLSIAGTMGMSLFVFAGSSQFIAAGLISTGASVGTIILTTLIVNLRHALYATTLAPHMRKLSQKWLLPLGFWLTDETFLVSVKRYSQADESPNKHWFMLGSALFMYTNWQLCTFLGVVAGNAIPNPVGWGLDFAMVATFIGMLVPMVKDRAVFVSIIVAAASALLLNSYPNQTGLFFATLLGTSTGVLFERVWGQ